MTTAEETDAIDAREHEPAYRRMTAHRVTGRQLGSPKTGGRQRGTPNKATREFRETVRELLEENAKNVGVWLRDVAEGNPATGQLPDPARALELLCKLAEYAAPKLGRVEHTGLGGTARPTCIEIEFVNSDPALPPPKPH